MTTERGPIQCWLTDMDGVLVHEDRALPGAADFLDRLRDKQRPFLVLTNNSIYTPRDLSARLARAGLHVPEQFIWTSALATAAFLADQLPGGSAHVIGAKRRPRLNHDEPPRRRGRDRAARRSRGWARRPARRSPSPR